MDRRVLWMCLVGGSTVGGFVPVLFGQSSFGLAAIVCSALGAAVGLWAAGRISASL